VVVNAYFDGFARTFDYSGRSTRAQYWLFQLFTFLVGLVVFFIIGWNWPELMSERGVDLPTVVFWIVHGVPLLSLTVRRLHDSGRSALWLLWLILPGIGMLVLLVMSLVRPDEGENDYGPDPREESWESPGHARSGVFEPAVTNRDPVVPLEALEKLQALRASGAIDETEFAAMKARLLRVKP